jgi:N-acetylmuramoyl-L-alanine amidase
MKKVMLCSFLFSFAIIGVVFPAQSYLPPGDVQQPEKKVTIIIDPGHGGGDWGINYRGMYEKNINLDVAKKLKEKLIKDNPRLIIYMTRTDDQFLSVNDRANYANSQKGDVFLSIHCDFVPSENISGCKVYYQQPDSVINKEKREIINWDMVQFPYVAESKKLANFIDQYMRAALIDENGNVTGNDEDDVLPLGSRGVAGVKSSILKSINMPAVVIELGNVYNRDDFSFLNSKNITDQIAYHIKEGIINYLMKVNYQ